MKATLITLLLYWMLSPIGAQSLSPEVIATSGSQYQNGTARLEWTLGEAVIETYANPSHMLSQGFHQPGLLATSWDEAESNFSLTVFPNPFSNELFVQVKGPQSLDLDYEIWAMEGKVLQRGRLHAISQTTSLEVGELPTGLYFLQIQNSSNHFTKTFKILKTH